MQLTIMELRLVDVMASFSECGEQRDVAIGSEQYVASLSSELECPGDSIPESILDSEEEEFRPRTSGSSIKDE